MFGGLIVLILLAGLALYVVGMQRLKQIFPDVSVETIDISTDLDAIARGRHIAIIWKCIKASPPKCFVWRDGSYLKSRSWHSLSQPTRQPGCIQTGRRPGHRFHLPVDFPGTSG